MIPFFQVVEVFAVFLPEFVPSSFATEHGTLSSTCNDLVHEPVGWSVSSGGINLNGNF